MSDSVRPHRPQPTSLPRPWDSPGKNTGVGCHFLLQCMKVKTESEVAQSCPTLSDPMILIVKNNYIFPCIRNRFVSPKEQVYCRGHNFILLLLPDPIFPVSSPPPPCPHSQISLIGYFQILLLNQM